MRSNFLARLLWSAIKPEQVERTCRPDVVLDDALTRAVYLKRWWLIPRNPVFNLYLHKFESSDPADEFHDHPWGNLSVVLRGSYIEWIVEGCAIRRFDRAEGDLVFRRGKTTHRIDLRRRFGEEMPCWTLFVTGPRLRRWGFRDVVTGKWTAWRDFGSRSKEARS